MQRLPDNFLAQNAAAMDAAQAPSLISGGRNYGEIPGRLTIEIVLAAIAGGGTWTPTLMGSDDGTTWRPVHVGTGRNANGTFMEYVDAGRLVWTQYRIEWTTTAGTVTATTRLRATLDR